MNTIQKNNSINANYSKSNICNHPKYLVLLKQNSASDLKKNLKSFSGKA